MTRENDDKNLVPNGHGDEQLDPQQDQRLDSQMNSLAGQLRDTGISPERDLWPDIDRAIIRADRIRPAPSHKLAGWRIAAMAASVLLLVGVGLIQHGGMPAGSNNPQAQTRSAGRMVSADFGGHEGGIGVQATSMKDIDQALVDLNDALADDPDNGSLSRLILMIHKSRGNLIRNTARRLTTPGL